MRIKIFLISLIILSSAYVFAEEMPVGFVTSIEGVSDISHKGQEAFMISEKQPVYLSDRIRTKNYSKVEIRLIDQSVLKLAPGSCLSIEEFKLLYNNARDFCRVKLTRGKVEAVVSKTGIPDTFVIETPNSRGSVKGSDIFVSYLAGRTGVFVQEGGISVFNPSLPDIKMNVNKGNCVFVPFEEAPKDLRPVLEVEMAIHKKDVEKSLIKKWVPSSGASRMNAEIVSIAGTVRVYKKGAQDWAEPKTGQSIEEGDKLQTSADGRIEVRLSNGNVLVLQANTELAFTVLRYDEKTGDFENTFDMSVGEVLGVVEKINKKSTFQLRTPTAVSGVRGTFLKVVVEPPRIDLPKPQTQVFFEGGNGIVTSVLTGQTKEVLAGHNIMVDTAGKITMPVMTSPEQRIAMVNTWTMGQTVNNYSTAKGFTGPGGQMAENKMPPPPMHPMEKPMAMFPPMKQDMQTQLTSTIIRPTEAIIFYRIPLNVVTGTTTAIVASATFMDFSMKSDGTWHAFIQAEYAATLPSSGWNMNFMNANGDSLQFTGVKVPMPMNTIGQWAAGPQDITSFTGEVKGTEIDKNLAFNHMAGNFGDNKFAGDVFGTWTDQTSVTGP